MCYKSWGANKGASNGVSWGDYKGSAFRKTPTGTPRSTRVQTPVVPNIKPKIAVHEKECNDDDARLFSFAVTSDMMKLSRKDLRSELAIVCAAISCKYCRPLHRNDSAKVCEISPNSSTRKHSKQNKKVTTWPAVMTDCNLGVISPRVRDLEDVLSCED